MGKLRHLGGAFAVEYAHQCIGSTKDDAVQHRCQHQCGAAAQDEQLSGTGLVAFAVALAHQRRLQMEMLMMGDTAVASAAPASPSPMGNMKI